MTILIKYGNIRQSQYFIDSLKMNVRSTSILMKSLSFFKLNIKLNGYCLPYLVPNQMAISRSTASGESEA